MSSKKTPLATELPEVDVGSDYVTASHQGPQTVSDKYKEYPPVRDESPEQR